MGLNNIIEIMKRDLKSSFKNPAVVIALIAIIILPSLYAVLNIDACWDPFGNTGDMKIAVANNDLNVTYNGKSVNFGSEIVNELKDNHNFTWQFVSEDKANDGIENGTYYAAIVIPKNFTNEILSINSQNPTQANLTFIINEKTNPIASRISNNLADELHERINAEVIQTVDSVAFNQIVQMGKSTQQQLSQLAQQQKMAKSALQQQAAYLAAEQQKIQMVEKQLNISNQSSNQPSQSLPSSQSSQSIQLSSQQQKLLQLSSVNESGLEDYFYSPVNLNREEVNPVDNYGSELSPFFIVLSIWVGCVISVALIKTRYLDSSQYSPLELYFGRLGLFMVIGLLQSTVTIVGAFYLGIQMENSGLFILSTYLITIALMVLIYSLVSIFGNGGKAIAIILLVIQISSTNGIYPVPVMNSAIQAISPYLPMTYAIELLRNSLLGIYWPTTLTCIYILIGILVVTLVLSAIIKKFFDKGAYKFEQALKDSGLF